MISEGSYDTDNWSNAAGNSALHKLKIYSYSKMVILNVIVFYNITIFTVFLIR